MARYVGSELRPCAPYLMGILILTLRSSSSFPMRSAAATQVSWPLLRYLDGMGWLRCGWGAVWIENDSISAVRK